MKKIYKVCKVKGRIKMDSRWKGFFEAIKKDGIVGFLVAIGYSGIATFVTVFIFDSLQVEGWFVILFIYYVIYYILRGILETCPKCGKRYAMREIEREQIDEKWVKAIDAPLTANSQGRNVYTKWAKKYTYECVEGCRFCGYQQKVKRSVIDD